MSHVPAFVEVTVIAAKQLSKGKGCTAFVTMQMSNGGKKFATETINHDNNPVWNEQCKLPITGLDANIQLCVLHRNKLGFEEFIGQMCLPLSEVKRIERRPLWVELEGKSGKSSHTSKERGQLQVEVQFLYEYVVESQSPPRTAISPEGSLPNSTTSSTSTSPTSKRRHSSSKAKKLVKGLASIAHDRSPRHSRQKKPSLGHSDMDDETSITKRNAAHSVEAVLKDLQPQQTTSPAITIPTSTQHGELGKESVVVTPPDNSPPHEESGPSDSVEDLSAPHSRRTSLKLRRRLSLPSVAISSPSRTAGTSIADTISEKGESPLRTRSGSHSKSEQNSPATQHKRNKSYSGGWISRGWGGGGSELTEEELIAQGNFSALSKQALVRLVSQQQNKLREKVEELSNLREYIDSVLMRVIAVNPDLLLNLSTDREKASAQRHSDSGRGSTSPDGDYPEEEDSGRMSLSERLRSLSNASNASATSATMTASSSQQSLPTLPSSVPTSTTRQRTTSSASMHSRSSSSEGSTIHLSKDPTSSLDLSIASARHRPN